MSTPSVAIVIKSYPPDYQWLTYCLKSIAKYARGFKETIVILPESAPLNLTLERVVLSSRREGYMEQQVEKLYADTLTDADFILHFDSDMVFTREITPEYFFTEGKPIWVKGPFCEETSRVWAPVMRKCLQAEPESEFMRKGAVIVPRSLYADFRSFIEQAHNVSTPYYVTSQPGREFSEYNCLGFYAWLHHRNLFSWHDTGTDGVPDWPWLQNWSWGGMTPEIRSKLEEITA